MKRFGLIFRYASSALVVLAALVFTVLEATLLITLDFNLYENQFIALVQLVLRFLIASSALSLGILSIVKIKRTFLPYSIFLLASSALMIPFMNNNIGVYITVVSALFMLSQLLCFKMRDKSECQDTPEPIQQ